MLESSDPLEPLRRAFSDFDHDADGRLNAGELQGALRAAGLELDGSEVQRLIASVDRDKDGCIDFREFMELATPVDVGTDPDEDVRQAFAVLDRDGDGYISREDLERAMGHLAPLTEEVEIGTILDAADRDGDHKISFDEFARLMFSS